MHHDPPSFRWTMVAHGVVLGLLFAAMYLVVQLHPKLRAIRKSLSSSANRLFSLMTVLFIGAELIQVITNLLAVELPDETVNIYYNWILFAGIVVILVQMSGIVVALIMTCIGLAGRSGPSASADQHLHDDV